MLNVAVANGLPSLFIETLFQCRMVQRGAENCDEPAGVCARCIKYRPRTVRFGGEDGLMSMDSEAVMRLYREHGPALRRFAASATSNPDQAEDIVQESILRVWQHAPERTTNMRGYLFRTARNVIIDNYRRRTHRPVEAGPDHLDDNSYSDGVDQLLLKLTVEEALGSLSPEHRGVIVALHYRGLTVAETAELLQIPVGTVKSRAYYGLRELRGALSGLGVKS